MIGALEENSLAPTDIAIHRIRNRCRKLSVEKYGNPPSPYMAARVQADYFPPEDQYESLIDQFLTAEMSWLDVGCGRAPFPNNLRLSAELSKRCRHFVGIDPHPNVYTNQFIHDRHQLSLEEFCPTQAFDLITARMVVEHVERPWEFAVALSRVTKPGSLVIIFTVNWLSITTLTAHLSPLWIHHRVKRLLWSSEEGETFRTCYKMNRRNTLRTLLKSAGFAECLFQVLPDASLFWRFPYLRRGELTVYKLTKLLRMPYLDSCILAAYRRESDTPQTALNNAK